MRRTWREHREALAEFRAAAHWYESLHAGLADLFIDAVDAAIDSVLDPTITWGFYRDQRSVPQVYSRSVAGFPFDIVYVILADEVFVVAYAHERRRPGYWERRIER